MIGRASAQVSGPALCSPCSVYTWGPGSGTLPLGPRSAIMASLQVLGSRQTAQIAVRRTRARMYQTQMRALGGAARAPVGQADLVQLLEQRGERARVEVVEPARDGRDGGLLGRQRAHDAQQVLHRHVAERHRLRVVAQLLPAPHLGHLRPYAYLGFQGLAARRCTTPPRTCALWAPGALNNLARHLNTSSQPLRLLWLALASCACAALAPTALKISTLPKSHLRVHSCHDDQQPGAGHGLSCQALWQRLAFLTQPFQSSTPATAHGVPQESLTCCQSLR